MKYLSEIELVNRSYKYGVITKDVDWIPVLLDFTWMDRKRRYFIASYSSLTEGRAYIRERWRQLDREYPNEYPEKVELYTPQPKFA